MYVYIYIHDYLCIHALEIIHELMRTYTWICLNSHARMYIYININIYIYMYIYIYE